MSRLKKKRRRIFLGLILWIVLTPMLAALFGNTRFVYAWSVGGWVVLAVYSLSYMYDFIFRKDE